MGDQMETRLFDVGRHRLAIYSQGSGKPIVVLEAGLEDKAAKWRLVQREVAEFTRVCSYDRAGRGQSEQGSGPRNSEVAVAELHRLLAAAGEQGPFVLVGHSYGGLNALLFAHSYPDEVAGLVLVDTLTPAWDILSLLPEELADEGGSLREFRALLRDQATQNAEGIDQALSQQQAAAVQTLGDLPLLVISRAAERWIEDVEGFFPDLPPGLAAKLEAGWQDQQRALLRLSSRTEQIVATQSSHNIPLDEPELVANAIRTMVTMLLDG